MSNPPKLLKCVHCEKEIASKELITVGTYSLKLLPLHVECFNSLFQESPILCSIKWPYKIRGRALITVFMTYYVILFLSLIGATYSIIIYRYQRVVRYYCLYAAIFVYFSLLIKNYLKVKMQ